MKTPGFWYQPKGLAANVLSPFGLLYRMSGSVRRMLAMPYRAQVPVICVGNIVAGGSGKTPTALALAEMLKQQKYNPVFVTCGYGGVESGPLRIDPTTHTATEVGDEALLLARAAPAWIGRDRTAAIRQAEKEATHIILDDGLQNPNVLPDLSLLVIDGETGLGNGCLIPAGPLRETLNEALKRVQAVVIIGKTNDAVFHMPHNSRAKVIAARIEPDLSAAFPRTQPFFAFAGIGRPEKFYQTCRATGMMLAGTQDFADHHVFTGGELDRLAQQADGLGAQLLTTDKDAVRLPTEFRARVMTLPVRLIFDEPGAIGDLLAIYCQKRADLRNKTT
jgi:tetraacyldisaccharide 4'-kinase